ncbi:hypothetical protein [Ottowia thiooxydans]|uniref:Phosphatidylethanolamine-binding protein (PEBP) family uncharacterized protein n=1 Tax=Ottowia thiooxydans TaxID=219182 RepID=A0ABV2Q979_9BURK
MTKVVAGMAALNAPTYFEPLPPTNLEQHCYQFTVIGIDFKPGLLAALCCA